MALRRVRDDARAEGSDDAPVGFILGLIGAPLLVGKTIAVAFVAFDELTITAMLFVLPIAAWELALGCWLTVEGLLPSPVLTRDPALI